MNFVIRKFKAYQKRSQFKEGVKEGAILLKAFADNWYFPEFMEWYSDKKKKEEQEEIARYGDVFEKAAQHVSKTGTDNKKPTNKRNILNTTFDLGRFKTENAELYQQIYKSQTESIQNSIDEYGVAFVTANKKMTIDQVIMKRVQFYCEECFREWNKGNNDFIPITCIKIDTE